MALKYSKPLQFQITFVLKNSDRNIVVRRLVFPKLSTNLIEPLVTAFGLVYIKIAKDVVAIA